MQSINCCAWQYDSTLVLSMYICVYIYTYTFELQRCCWSLEFEEASERQSLALKNIRLITERRKHPGKLVVTQEAGG